MKKRLHALPYRPFTSRMINFSPLVTTNSHSWKPLTKELETTWKIIASHEGSKKWIVTIATVSKHENLYIKTFQSIYGMVFIWINLCVILFLWIKENRYRHFNLFYCCKIFRMDRSFFSSHSLQWLFAPGVVFETNSVIMFKYLFECSVDKKAALENFLRELKIPFEVEKVV